jgi:Fic family protein
MTNTIQKIKTLQRKLLLLPTISDDNKRKLDKKFRLEFNYNSNHIEGNTLTYAETELLLIFDKTEGGHNMRELEEMKAHDVAYQLIQEWATNKQYPLTEQSIKELNKIILVQPFYKDAKTVDGQATRRLIKIGDYKEHPNSVQLQNGEMFHYASPAETPIKMGELLQWYHEELNKKELHPIELAALLHYKFVLIHPFDDGNGRISRLLMNYILLANDLPPVIIKSEDKKNYLFALNQADTGNIEAFVNYIAKQLEWSLEMSIKASKGESVDEIGDLDKRLELYNKSKGIGEANIEKYSIEIFTILIEKELWHLFSALEKTMLKFDKYFINRTNYIIINSTQVEQIESYDNARGLIQSLDYTIVGSNITSISLATEFKHSNKQMTISGIHGGRLNLQFFQNQYSINTDTNSNHLYKYYNEQLTDEEIRAIVEELGNRLFTNTIENL